MLSVVLFGVSGRLLLLLGQSLSRSKNPRPAISLGNDPEPGSFACCVRRQDSESMDDTKLVLSAVNWIDLSPVTRQMFGQIVQRVIPGCPQRIESTRRRHDLSRLKLHCVTPVASRTRQIRSIHTLMCAAVAQAHWFRLASFGMSHVELRASK